MLPLFPFLVFLHGLQRGTNLLRFFCGAALAVLAIMYAFNSLNAVEPLWEKERTATSIEGASNATLSVAEDRASRRKKAVTLTTIQTTNYEASLYWAIPFTPRGTGEGLVQPDSGSHFVLLDIAVKNTTADWPVDVGNILLTAKIRDENGREYVSNPLIIAAFNLEYPFPDHKEQYSSLRGILHPGETYRTVALGFEAPVETKKFVLLLEESNNNIQNKYYKAAFCLK